MLSGIEISNFFVSDHLKYVSGAFWKFLLENLFQTLIMSMRKDYSCPGATFTFCSHGEKLLPGVVQLVLYRLSKLPRGNEKLM